MRHSVLGAVVSLAASGFAGAEFPRPRSNDATANPAPLVFSTHFGGGSTDVASAVAVDGGGNSYVAGWTASTDLPVKNAFQSQSGGGVDAFVAKFDPVGALVYCTYLGGSGDDRAFGIAVDAAGAVYITGWTASTDFPTAGNPYQRSLAGGLNAFVAKLGATGGSLIFSTFLGGGASDQGRAIALDASGDAFIAGQTTSSNFPTLNPLQAGRKGLQDAFVAEVGGSGGLLFSTYLGGSGTDTAAAIAVGADGCLYLTGATDSLDFPTLNAIQPVNGGYQDAFVTKLSPGGASLVFSTYLGGSGGSVDYPETGLAIAVDPNNNVYVAGVTSSSNFPTRNALQPALAGWTDAFVAKVDATGTLFDFSTYLGGSSLDYGVAIRVDSSGAACVAGYSTSPNFPLANPVQSGSGGSYDAFLSCLTSSGQALLFSSLLGGSNSDAAYGLAMDTGFLYVAGLSASSDFPLKNPFQSLNTNGKISAFLSKLTRYQTLLPLAPVLTFPGNGAVNVSLSPTLTWNAASWAASYAVYFGASPSPPLVVTTANLSYSPGALAAGATYYWQVAGNNSAGSSASGVDSFTTVCTYGITPPGATPGAGTSTGSVAVVAPAGCSWTASSDSTTWLTITSESSGSGNGAVGYAVTANPNSTARGGTLTIAGQSFTVTQAGAACAYSLGTSSGAPGTGAGSGSVTVTAPGGCGWTASSNSTTWLTIASGSTGVGNGTVGYAVTANYLMAVNLGSAQRTGTLIVAGQPFTVTQAVAAAYLIGDVAPYTTDTAPYFGDGILNILDLIQELFAVDNVPGFRPAACSDRFDAMDLYPADTASTRGGDGVLDIRDLILELFRVDNLDMARPVRTSPGGGCQSADSQGAAKTSGARPSHGAPPKLRAEIPSAVLLLGDPEALSETEERVSVTLKADRDLARVAVTFAMGDQLSDLGFVATAETPPSLAQDSLPGVVAAAWLAGLSVPAGERILLGYVEGPAGALANLKVYGLSASGLDDNREVRLEVSGTRQPGVIPANGSGGESEN
jgi:hypothetical protein